MNGNPVHIYVLKDPRDGIVRYVGKTECALKKRLVHHLHSSKKPADHKARWMAKLVRDGVTPIIESIEVCPFEIWQERECFWIKKYRDDGFDLTNTAEGGKGANGELMRAIWTPERRRKWGEAVSARNSSDEARARLRESGKAVWEVPGYREMQSEIHKKGHTPETRNAARLILAETRKHPGFQDRVNAGSAASWTPERLARRSIISKNCWNDERKKQHSLTISAQKNDPEKKAAWVKMMADKRKNGEMKKRVPLSEEGRKRRSIQQTSVMAARRAAKQQQQAVQ